MKIYCFALSVLIATIAVAQVEEINFTSEELTLEGSLYIPQGEGPFPAVVLVHGSGPVNRYQTAELVDGNSQCIYPELANKTIENFKDIADHLYKKGIAVLTYDKRSFTFGMELDPITTSTKDFIVDVENAVDYLSAHPKVSSENIFLIGHSQGSTLIPIAAQNKNLAGLISLSGAITPPDTLVAEQFRELYIQCEGDTITGMIVANRFYREFTKLRNNELPDTTQITIRVPGGDPTMPFEFGYPIFWKDWIEMAEQVIDNYKATNLPILLIQGDDDFNIPLNDVHRFENGLPADLTTVEIFEGVNHLLTTAISPKVSPLVLESITNWINKISTVATDIEENDLAKHFQIQFADGMLHIQSLRSTYSSLNLHSLYISSIDGRILHQVSLKNKSNYSLRVNPADKMVVLSFFNDKEVFSQLIQTN